MRHGAHPGARVLAGVLANRGFVACAILLALFAAGYQTLASFMKIRFNTAALPLRTPLDQLDQKKLYPYELLHPFLLKPEMLDALGTKQYIQWLLRDTSMQENSPDKFVSLFVTYYTGDPGQVPHVPEVCYLGSGYRPVDQTIREVSVPALGEGVTVPIHVLEFERSALLGGNESKIVMYTFHANGRFCPTREAVRAALANPLNKYAYFSKLEVTFGTQEAYPAKDKALAAGEKFLRIAIPVLVKEHWPDWEAANAATVPDSRPAAGAK